MQKKRNRVIGMCVKATWLLLMAGLWLKPVLAAETELRRDRYLVLDSRFVERVKNGRLVLGSVAKSPHNPLMKEDQPWEKRYDNLYANIVYDRQAGVYKCWYSPFIVDHSSSGMTLEERQRARYKPPENREMALCYATSDDGIQWDKPSLGLVVFDSGRENNMLWRGPHGAGVFKDTADADPDRRYKILFVGDQMGAGFSDDGIHWKNSVPCPEMKGDIAGTFGDTHNNAFWAPTLGRYVAITRTWRGRTRLVARSESEDFLKWSKAAVVLEGLDTKHQLYAMPVCFHGGVYLGLLAVFHTETDRVTCELAWSPDTVKWERICPGSPLIDNAAEEMVYDWGCVYAAACPVFLEHEIRIYYGGSDGAHTTWRNGFLCLATLRPDGFAGYEPISEDQPAVISTTAVAYEGQAVQITADVKSGGWVKVVVTDENGTVLATAQPVLQSVTDACLKLDTPLKADKIQFEVELHKARVYSFNMSR